MQGVGGRRGAAAPGMAAAAGTQRLHASLPMCVPARRCGCWSGTPPAAAARACPPPSGRQAGRRAASSIRDAAQPASSRGSHGCRGCSISAPSSTCTARPCSRSSSRLQAARSLAARRPAAAPWSECACAASPSTCGGSSRAPLHTAAARGLLGGPGARGGGERRGDPQAPRIGAWRPTHPLTAARHGCCGLRGRRGQAAAAGQAAEGGHRCQGRHVGLLVTPKPQQVLQETMAPAGGVHVTLQRVASQRAAQQADECLAAHSAPPFPCKTCAGRAATIAYGQLWTAVLWAFGGLCLSEGSLFPSAWGCKCGPCAATGK